MLNFLKIYRKLNIKSLSPLNRIAINKNNNKDIELLDNFKYSSEKSYKKRNFYISWDNLNQTDIILKKDNGKCKNIKNNFYKPYLINNLFHINKSVKINKKKALPLSTINSNNYRIVKLNSNNIKTNTQIELLKDKSEIQTIKKKNLVLDLDETLIHSFFNPIENSDFQLNIQIYDEINNKEYNKIYIKKRPGLNIFLNELNKYYKIYIFSSSPEDYVSEIVKNIDKKRIIVKFFSKNDCLTIPGDDDFGIYIKDLKKIDKDLSNILLLDDNITSFTLQTENGIPIKSWNGNDKDIELFKLIPLFKKLSYYKDVRKEIKKFVIDNNFSWNKCLKWLNSDSLRNIRINNSNKK